MGHLSLLSNEEFWQLGTQSYGEWIHPICVVKVGSFVLNSVNNLLPHNLNKQPSYRYSGLINGSLWL